jgi:hypothetical protein
MPDFFDRLIARGTQPGGSMPSSGQPAHEAGPASEPSSGATVTFARPRLPGPFEWPATEPADAFLEAVDEVRELGARPPGTAQARPSLAGPAGTRAAITPPPPLRDSTISRAPGSARTGPGQELLTRTAPAQQDPLLPSATPVYLIPEAGAALDQVSARVGRPAADGDHEPDVAASAGRRPEHPIPPPTRPLAVPAIVVRAARPAADNARAAQAQPPAPPPVVVRIGRIEVRNPSLDRRERQPKRRAARAAPRQTLAAYLASASGGRNGNGVGQGSGR